MVGLFGGSLQVVLVFGVALVVCREWPVCGVFPFGVTLNCFWFCPEFPVGIRLVCSFFLCILFYSGECFFPFWFVYIYLPLEKTIQPASDNA